MNTKERYYEIDLFRFLAAFAVVMYHYTFRGFAGDHFSPINFPTLGKLFQYGYLGVDLFFMISGYVIFLTALNRKPYSFVVSRVTRLYPAFWISATLTFLVILLSGNQVFSVSWKEYLYNMTMLHGFLNIRDVDGVYWSLLIEIKFYILVFVLITLNQMKYAESYLWLWLVLSVATIFLDLPYIGFFIIPEWSCYFIAGASFYLIRRNGLTFMKALLISLSYAMTIYNAMLRSDMLTRKFMVDFSHIHITIYITIFYILFVFVSLNRTKLINHKTFFSLGILTYPLYLLHGNIGFIVLTSLNGRVNKYLLLVGLTISMLVLSLIVHKLFEKKISLKLKSLMTRPAEQV